VAELLTLDEALAAVLERVEPLPSEPVRSDRAAGRVLAESARAVVDLPPFPSSAMDGYAVRAADTPGRLPVVFRIAAGVPAERPLGPAQAMAIATGGVVPEGADAVVAKELVVADDNEVEIPETVSPGTNVRPRAGDIAAGAVVVKAGTRLGSAQVGALAAAGIAKVTCARRARVAVLTTGTELRRPGAVLGRGEVYEANGAMLAARLSAAGAEVERLDSVADDDAAHRRALAQGLALDVLVSSGGVSVGPHDLVRRAAAELGVEEIFWGVAVKPGKPVSFGVCRGTLVFGLPGNPVSALVCCELFVIPGLRRLEGEANPWPPFEVGMLLRSARRDPRRDELARALAVVGDDDVLLDPVSGQESHMIARAAEANALVLIPRGEGELESGSRVRYLRLGTLGYAGAATAPAGLGT
jgi:molybdopterin molybdotransferase